MDKSLGTQHDDPYLATTDYRTLIEPEDGVFSALARLPDMAIVNEKALAAMFGVCGRTIRRMVERKEIPPPIKTGNRSCWLAGNVLRWLADSAQKREQEVRKFAQKLDF